MIPAVPSNHCIGSWEPLIVPILLAVEPPFSQIPVYQWQCIKIMIQLKLACAIYPAILAVPDAGFKVRRRVKGKGRKGRCIFYHITQIQKEEIIVAAC